MFSKINTAILCASFLVPLAATTAEAQVPDVRTEPSVETPAPPAPEFPSWTRFSDGIRDLWPRMYHRMPERLRDDPQARQEVARLMIAALARETLAAISADGDHPVFLPLLNSTLNLSQPNADTVYRRAVISPGGTYRLRGTPGSLPIFKMVQLGPTPDQTGGGVKAIVYQDFSTLKLDSQGRFDVILSPERPKGHEGDWWRLYPGAMSLMLRQVSSDWAKETDPTISIERLDMPVARPRVPAAELEARLVDLPRRASNTANFLVDHVEQLRDGGYINRLRVFDVSNGTALEGQFYYEGAYELAPGEALILESEVPDKCVYWSLILTNDIYETTDWYNNLASINNAQARVDEDGKLRVVVSARDPGVPNWLDISGYPSGVIQGRWTGCDSQPMPVLRKIAVKEVRANLPSETPTLSGEQRAQQIRERRSAAQQRPLW